MISDDTGQEAESTLNLGRVISTFSCNSSSVSPAVCRFFFPFCYRRCAHVSRHRVQGFRRRPSSCPSGLSETMSRSSSQVSSRLSSNTLDTIATKACDALPLQRRLEDGLRQTLATLLGGRVPELAWERVLSGSPAGFCCVGH